MKKIAVLTSGGDAPGMNGAIRAIVRVGIKRGFEVYGVYGGFRGLVEGKIKKLGYSEVQDKAIDNLKGYDIDSLIVIGGDGSYRGALSLSKKGINCIGIPGTIDNDINGTDETIGFHTALSNIIDAVNKLRDTSSSHHRCFVIEVMGNNADSLALYSAISCGSELVITHKTGFDEDFVIAEMIKNETVYNKRHAIIIVSEKILDVDNLAKRISEETGFSGRAIVLGHIQRGGSPVPEDRILASRMAGKAIELLINNESGKCVCLKNSEIVAMGIEEALKETNQSKELLYQLFEDLV